MNIIPKPNGVSELRDGKFAVEKLASVYLDGFEASCLAAFEARIDKMLEQTSSEHATLVLRHDQELSPEGYSLLVEADKITITAFAEAGVIWALVTLYSLEEKGNYPAIYLEDAPRYAHRGFLLDCVRHFFPVETVKEIIEINSLSKLNVLHWTLTNDQGWRIESKVFPKLHQTDGQEFFTQDEIREVAAFAKERGVEVIPEIDMPGHTIAAIAAYPELSCAGEPVALRKQAGISPLIFCAGNENTYDFVKALLDEICPLFESPYFHIGGDEAPKRNWEQCPKCQERLAGLGSDDFEDLQGYFTQVIAAHLTKLGKTTVCWNDVLASDKLPENIVIQQWLDTKRPSRTKEFLDNGGKVVFSDMFSLYFDYPVAMTPLSKVYNYSPVIDDEDFSDSPGCEGIQACLWSEKVETKEKLYQRIYPRLFAVAEVAWTTQRDYSDFKRRLVPKLAEMSAKGIPFLALKKSNPKGIIRKIQVLKVLRTLGEVIEDDKEETLPLSPEMVAYFMEQFDIKIPKRFLPS